MKAFDKVHARTENYGHLVVVCVVMLAFSAFLLYYETTSNSAQPVSSPTSHLVRFCVLILGFLSCLFWLTRWAARNEIGSDDDIIGMSVAASRPGGTALAALLTFIALLVVGIGWNAIISYQHLHSRGTQFLTITNDGEAILFLLTAMTAGFVEEYVFRGYLQRRFTVLTGSVWTGALLQLAFFTLAHLYQGWSGLVSVFLLGSVLTFTALKCRTLMPGMLAHAFGDALGPLAFLAHHVLRSGH